MNRINSLLLAAAAGFGATAPALAQDAATVVRPLAGTRLDIVASGMVTRVPDLAIVGAGVQTLAPTAVGAIAANAERMERVRAALRRAGIDDRDIQTSSLSLSPDYRYDNNQPPVLTGYRASNNVSVKFRDLKRTGTILDALVAQGANQISGPTLTLDKPDAATDEARVRAIAAGRARADLYARALGMRVVRLLAVSEGGAMTPGPIAYASDIVVTGQRLAKTEIDPGTTDLSVSVSMSFELQ